MTEKEIERLADAIVARQHHQPCPMGLTPAAVAMVNAIAQAWETGTKAALKTAVGVVVTAVFGLLVLGLKHYLTKP